MRVLPSLHHLATAAGLLMPLASLSAQADPRSWVDPPAKSGAAMSGQDKSSPDKSSSDKGIANSSTAPAIDRATPKVTEKTAPPSEDKSDSEGMTKASAKEVATKAAATKDATARDATGRSRLAHTPPRPGREERVARHRSPPPRRLAETPAANGIPSGYAPAGRVEAAQALALEYLSVVSSPGEAMVGATPRFYGTRVRFYGRPATQADLLDEKRGFVRRWPERRYAARAFNTRCTADGSTCVVRAIVDFRAASPERGVVSKGASELVLELSFAGQRPVIVAESGRVLHRGPDRAEGPGAGRG